MDLAFLAVVFGLVFGSQAFGALKLFIFPDYYKGFYGLKFGLWLMCIVFDGFVIHKL
jgi:ABC-type thiamin/hydroxymethylpyrimidine transport system permease subunit